MMSEIYLQLSEGSNNREEPQIGKYDTLNKSENSLLYLCFNVFPYIMLQSFTIVVLFPAT